MENACCVWDFRVSLLDNGGHKTCIDLHDWDESEETLPEFREQRDNLRQWLQTNTKKWAFQLEAGDMQGYLHFQGRFSLKEKLRKKNLLQLFDSYDDIVTPHYLEPTSKEVAKSKDMFYVIKFKTRVSGPWEDKDEEVFIPRQYQGYDGRLYPYQKQVLDVSTFADFRIVNLVVDPTGNKGKTVASALAELKGRGIDVPPILDAKELIQIVCDICISRNERSPDPVIIDLPRSVDKAKLAGVYTAIEQIKKGKLYDPRHKYKSWWINSPHVWVFTNAPPMDSLLSNDRWKIWQINSKMELEPYEPVNEFESDESPEKELSSSSEVVLDVKPVQKQESQIDVSKVKIRMPVKKGKILHM